MHTSTRSQAKPKLSFSQFPFLTIFFNQKTGITRIKDSFKAGNIKNIDKNYIRSFHLCCKVWLTSLTLTTNRMPPWYSCLLYSSITSEPVSSTCKGFCSYRLFVSSYCTIYKSNPRTCLAKLFPNVFLSRLKILAAVDNQPPIRFLPFKLKFSFSFMDFTKVFKRSDISSERWSSRLGMSSVKASCSSSQGK